MGREALMLGLCVLREAEPLDIWANQDRVRRVFMHYDCFILCLLQ